jgi:hypothetical protein
VDSPRLASIGGQSKKLKISTFNFWMGDGRVLGEVFLGFGRWVRRFGCVFFFPEECMG